MPVSSIVTILVSLVVQFVDGNQRTVYVSESISDNEDFFSGGDVDGNLMCCVYGNCSCNSLDHALANLTSNVLINITTDVTFSSPINISIVANVSIIGHNNPTVNCKRAGGIHFNFCHNCIIQDITWDGCGTETEAGIKLGDSSNIVFENCSLRCSKGSTIVLSRVSGHVNISHCNFVHNNHYRGHGSAIHYSSSNVTSDLQHFFTISNCNFTYNHYAKSLVHIDNAMSKHNSNVILQNIKFCHNQGVSIYVVNQNIYLLEKVLFHNNTAESGTAIYMKDHSTVILGKNSDVAIMQNSADYNGGAVLLRNHSSIIFDQNSMATLNHNNATCGIIYSEVNCIVKFQASSEVTFSSNSVQENGSALYSSDNCHITFAGNAKVTFINNNVRANNWLKVGTIYSEHSHISFEGNSVTLFRDNFAYDGSGAINSRSNSIFFKDNSTTKFTNNTTGYDGGAICSIDSFISFEDNSTTEFANNTAGHYGGAVCSIDSFISFKENSTTKFTNNTATVGGGAIYARDGSISFEEISTTEFTNNTATDGGAMNSEHTPITFKHISNTTFTNNVAIRNGGAIFSSDMTVSSKGNSHIIIQLQEEELLFCSRTIQQKVVQQFISLITVPLYLVKTHM